jgi:hypothetical protein
MVFGKKTLYNMRKHDELIAKKRRMDEKKQRKEISDR